MPFTRLELRSFITLSWDLFFFFSLQKCLFFISLKVDDKPLLVTRGQKLTLGLLGFSEWFCSVGIELFIWMVLSLSSAMSFLIGDLEKVIRLSEPSFLIYKLKIVITTSLGWCEYPMYSGSVAVVFHILNVIDGLSWCS